MKNNIRPLALEYVNQAEELIKRKYLNLNFKFWVIAIRKYSAQAILFLLILLSIGCGNGKNKAQQFQTQTQSQWDGRTIRGTVKNMNDAHISFVSVEYDIVDKKYLVIRTVTASSDKGIEPNGEWGFEIEAGAVGATSTRLKNTVTR